MKTAQHWIDRLDEVSSERDQQNWVKAIQADARKQPMKKSRLLKIERNNWRDCATKLANATVKAVPLVCLDEEERHAGEIFDKLNRAAALSNKDSTTPVRLI